MSAASPSAERRVCSASSVSGGFHIAICARGAGRAVLVDVGEVVQPGQPLGQLDRVGDRGARHQEARRRAVGGADPAQAAQDVARRASRRRRGRRAPRRPRPRPGWRRSRPTPRGWGGSPCATCPGWSGSGWSACGSPCAPRAWCRRRRSPGARGGPGGTTAIARAWSCASALVGYRYSARALASVHSTSSVGRLKHMRLARRGAGRHDERRRRRRSPAPSPGGGTATSMPAPRSPFEQRRVQVVGQRREHRRARALERLAHQPLRPRGPRPGAARQGSGRAWPPLARRRGQRRHPQPELAERAHGVEVVLERRRLGHEARGVQVIGLLDVGRAAARS